MAVGRCCGCGQEVLVTVLSGTRYSLATIRILNGLLALAAPSLIIKRFGEDPDKDAAAIYGLRLFGVRTVLIGLDLIIQRGEPLEHSLKQAVLIHASDTLTAAALGTSKRIRPRLAVLLTLISALNTALAVAACLHARREAKP